jgi:putative flavoprotein involved in K+ transport
MRTAVTIVGGGPAGLAMSRCLVDRGIDHVVLERGEVANSWRTERWDSLRLLTPNWMTRLPGFAYDGDQRDSFMTASRLADLIDHYSRSFEAPVLTRTAVTAVRPWACRFVVETERGPIDSRAVVIASGANGRPSLPRLAAQVPGHLTQVHTLRYRRPDQLGTGGVLVVGASASGVQIADELQRSGRDVTIAVGDHVRLPRTYRGRDIYQWMDVLGLLDERYTDVEDLARARRLPSAQLVGTPERRSLGLEEVQQAGVRLVGRLVGAERSRAQFSGSLANFLRSADLKQERLLDRVDARVATGGLADEVPAPNRPAPTRIPVAVNAIPWQSFESVVWATGYRAQHPWLDPVFLDRHGQIPHEGGVTRHAGMYVLGLPFLRRRSSSFICGLERDAVELADHVAAHLGATARAA